MQSKTVESSRNTNIATISKYFCFTYDTLQIPYQTAVRIVRFVAKTWLFEYASFALTFSKTGVRKERCWNFWGKHIFSRQPRLHSPTSPTLLSRTIPVRRPCHSESHDRSHRPEHPCVSSYFLYRPWSHAQLYTLPAYTCNTQIP